MKEIVIGGVYRHYKGNNYKVIGVAKNAESLEEMVFYETLYYNKEGKYWCRSFKNFVEKIEYNGQSCYRFQHIG